MSEPVRVLSLGAGVQSSMLALQIAHGEVDAIDFAVFADTQDEPREGQILDPATGQYITGGVYGWLDWLETKVPFPIHRVSRGHLGRASTTVRTSKTGSKYIKPMVPAYIDRNGKKGLAQRHCTSDYKIDMILREINKHRNKRPVVQLLGISVDEAQRMKPAPRPWLTNTYPLVDQNITRTDCLAWMEFWGYPQPPRSACIYCPFHSDAEWVHLKTSSPAEFDRAVDYEKRLQVAYAGLPTMTGVPYLHASRKPLETVQFAEGIGEDQFGNECAGVCGV